jgi:ubiquinone/menaquinone biosynthesis C-methylase UbiE
MLVRRALRPLLRFAFHLFYNPFAFTYDFVSALVSRGHWRDWTRAALPHLVGRRVLEIPCGTGNLLVDLIAAGFQPIGVDLSPNMLRISQSKLRSVGALHATPLLRARAQALPFASQAFDSITMTFPPGFVFDSHALAELRRVLADRGRLVWVDGGRLQPIDLWSRALNWALDATSGEGDFGRVAAATMARAGFASRVETVRDEASIVQVVIATKS